MVRADKDHLIVKLPQFYRYKRETLFRQMESQFVLLSFSKEEKMFQNTFAVLPEEVKIYDNPIIE